MWKRLDPYGIFRASWAVCVVLFLLIKFTLLGRSRYNNSPHEDKSRG